MHDAAAATEVVYYASKKLDESSMHYEHRQQAPWRCGAIRPGGRVLLLLLLLLLLEKTYRPKTESDERTGALMVRLVFRLWLAESGFALSQRQATSKVSIGIFVRFLLASSAGRSVHTAGSLPPAATLRTKKGHQLAGPVGKPVFCKAKPRFSQNNSTKAPALLRK